MREHRGSVLWFLLAFVFAFVAAFIAHSSYQKYTSGVPVVVATRFVGPMQPVPGNAVQLLNRPKQGLPGDALRNTTEAVGHYTLYGLVPGEIVQSGALISTRLPGTILDAKLQELAKREAGAEYRAYVLPLNVSSGYLLAQPGDRVDVIAQVKSQQGGEAGVLLQQALVLGRIGKSGQVRGTPIPGQPNPSQNVTSGNLVLALTQHQIATLALAEATGKVSVALAAPGTRAASHAVLSTQVFPPAAPSGSSTGSKAVTAPAFTGKIRKP